MQVTIRKARPSDTEELSALAAQTFAEAWSPVIGEKSARAYAATYLTPDILRAEIIATEKCTIDVAVENETAAILGYTKLDWERFAPSEVTGTNPVLLQRLYVLAAGRGVGVADALLQFAIEVAKQRDKQTLWLECDPRNSRAARFYTKRGFVAVGKTVYYHPGGYNDQVAIMERSIFPSAP